MCRLVIVGCGVRLWRMRDGQVKGTECLGLSIIIIIIIIIINIIMSLVTGIFFPVILLNQQ